MAERAYRSLNSQQLDINVGRVPERGLSPRSSSEFARPMAPPSPSMAARSMPSPGHAHRSSFSESLRGVPPSPRSTRHLSISSNHSGVQELLNNPPRTKAADPKFAGRDWHTITVGELVNPDDLRWVEVDTPIEDATNYLMEASVPVLMIRADKTSNSAVATFDFKDLNQYLLFATGSLRPDSDHISFFQDLAKKAQAGKPIPLREAKNLGFKEPFITIAHTAKLTQVVETFGSGVHRLIVVKEWTNDVIGLVSQFRLVNFLWENAQCFPVIDQLYAQTLRELRAGSQKNLISINGDRPLRDALLLMDMEGISSLAVVDNQMNVVGNISTADVRLLTKASSAPLLDNTCIHFIGVILSSRGMDDGKDAVPVFYVNPYSTLAHTVAKLVATKSHRMWVVDSPSPSSSAPSTPLLPPSGGQAVLSPPPRPASPQVLPPINPSATTPSVSAAALPGARMSGRLSGVVSLTDVLNLFARVSGLNPLDPIEARKSRRRSSSASLNAQSARDFRETSLSSSLGSVRGSIDEKRDNLGTK